MGALSKSTDSTHALPELAHELANLLQVVNGNLELLDERVADEPARRYLTNARLAAAHLGELSRVLSSKVRS
ncbi:MAG TPA: hypothetical protein VNR60_09690 [Croceibacterium sp.]|nr:hypothetical protein [Croceibacterium sp.]